MHERAAVFAREETLEMTGSRQQLEELVWRMIQTATTLEGGVKYATRVFQATKTSRDDIRTRELIYHLIHKLNDLLECLRPRPSPVPLLELITSHQDRIRLAFPVNKDPLVNLLEVYSRLYTRDRRRLDPSAAAPPPDVLVELESLRVRHLAAVRAIHQAMRKTTAWKPTMRSEVTLMGACNQGNSFEEGWEIWEAMRAEGGVGIDQRAVSVVSPAVFCSSTSIS